MSNLLDTAATSQYINLLTFIWQGGAVTAKYAVSDRDYSDFAAQPAVSIDFGKQTGGVEDVPATIQMPVIDPVASMLIGYPFSKTTVLIEEVDINNTGTRRKLFFGQISQCTGNKNGNAALVEIKVAGLKSYLNFPLGIPALNTCAWAFGDKNCTIDLSTIRETKSISTIGGTLITLASAITAQRFSRGIITVAGTSLLIRSQVNTTQLNLINPPPASWVGQSAVMTPGCLKTVADCGAAKWNNLLNFGGFGIAIPKFNPSTETQ